MDIIKIDDMIVVKGIVTLYGKFEYNRAIEKREILLMYNIYEPLETEEMYTEELFNSIKKTVDSHDNYYLEKIEFYGIDGTFYHSHTF
jgi:hypothetical protein